MRVGPALRLFIEEVLRGRPSQDQDHPDYIPSVFPYRRQGNKERKMARYNRRQRRCEEGKENVEAPDEPDEAPHQPEEVCGGSEASIATELTGNDIDALIIENARLKQKLNEAQDDLKLAQSEIRSLKAANTRAESWSQRTVEEVLKSDRPWYMDDMFSSLHSGCRVDISLSSSFSSSPSLSEAVSVSSLSVMSLKRSVSGAKL
ncbi:hypothetical protein HPB47_001997 [Ixodes persulcatus]|uniref:Uncharacterized protein n=1 Tax=Ixodes persulcatus TaxID=34615 RepID=A0AC60PP99_IXOPE|nr:hypothetical protein HPB47_001997 [Ixodes persulcatus]